MEIRLRGIGVSPGIAIGPALNFGAKSLDVPRYKIEDVDAELARFELAVQGVRRELEGLYERTKAEVGEHHARIFQTHLMFLEDPMLHDDIQQRLRDEGYNIEFALNDLIARYAKLLKEVDDPMIRERQQDVLDVGTRLLNILLNAEVENLTSLDRPSIIVARDLSPSETATLDMDNTLGLVTDVSGPTSHTAILARAFGLPSVVGLKYVSQHVAQGDTIIVDGSDGLVVIRPNAVTLDDFQGRQLKFEEERRHLLFQEQESRNITLDDVEIPAMANIELPIELSASQKARAQGIGLYRSEYLFLNRPVLPTEDEQFEAYSAVASAMMPHPVILRTLDLGGDKFASHLSMADELNPQLGWRAIRFCLERPDIFKCQLRAMFRASVHGNVQIMFPLISGLDELLRVKEVVNEVTVDLEARRVSFDCGIKFGAMIEVPSAVDVAEHLAEECDFFSIGTNDLIQYSLAVDRVNEKIAHMYEPAHPSILRKINQTVKAAQGAGIPCGLCGEMAGDPLFTEVLIGLGVTSLSMSAVAIPQVRARIQRVNKGHAEAFAQELLRHGSVVEIRRLLQERYQQEVLAEK